MLIIRDTTGLTIKRTIQSANHVRVGTTQAALWVDGVRRAVRDIGARYGKPGCEFTINDCNDLLEEMEYLERLIA